MASIDEIIQCEVNPFDPTTFKPGNFWGEKQDSELTVESIHQEAITEIEALLDLVAKDHRSRTVLLSGDSGSGKTYLLGRLKRTLNSRAFFAYIDSWADSDYIWRHTLRYTVDSLVQKPEGQTESQLLLWLKGLSALREGGFRKWILGERKLFIHNLQATHPSGIFNAKEFFGMLYDLTNPELYPLACDWLRGDDLDENDLKQLRVKRAIETEDTAKNILSNFGRISAETQPIVLCFDNLDNIPRLPDGFQDLQALFNVNTTIHNDYLKDFLVIISIVTNNWKRNVDRIQMSDKAGIHQEVYLKRITLNQAEALWAYRLQPLHYQANPQPTFPAFPLTRQALEQKFPGGRTDPRNALILGGEEYQRYKNELRETKQPTSPEPSTNPLSPPSLEDKIQAEFQLIWQNEYSKVQGRITKITLLAAPELVWMLQEALAALQVKEIKSKLLSGRFASYSFSYQQAGQPERTGVVWTEDPGMRPFYDVMNAYRKVDKNLYQVLKLIRAAGVGTPNLAGNQIYRQIFAGAHHCHIKPALSSVHYLATYHSLVNAALANELVVAGKTVTLKELEALIRESKILNKCTLLQGLGVISSQKNGKDNGNSEDELQDVSKYLLNLVKTQGFMARKVLVQNTLTLSQFSQVTQSQIDSLIQQLCQAHQIRLINPDAPPKDQLVCFVPQA